MIHWTIQRTIHRIIQRKGYLVLEERVPFTSKIPSQTLFNSKGPFGFPIMGGGEKVGTGPFSRWAFRWMLQWIIQTPIESGPRPPSIISRSFSCSTAIHGWHHNMTAFYFQNHNYSLKDVCVIHVHTSACCCQVLLWSNAIQNRWNEALQSLPSSWWIKKLCLSNITDK